MAEPAEPEPMMMKSNDSMRPPAKPMVFFGDSGWHGGEPRAMRHELRRKRPEGVMPGSAEVRLSSSRMRLSVSGQRRSTMSAMSASIMNRVATLESQPEGASMRKGKAWVAIEAIGD